MPTLNDIWKSVVDSPVGEGISAIGRGLTSPLAEEIYSVPPLLVGMVGGGHGALGAIGKLGELGFAHAQSRKNRTAMEDFAGKVGYPKDLLNDTSSLEQLAKYGEEKQRHGQQMDYLTRHGLKPEDIPEGALFSDVDLMKLGKVLPEKPKATPKLDATTALATTHAKEQGRDTPSAEDVVWADQQRTKNKASGREAEWQRHFQQTKGGQINPQVLNSFNRESAKVDKLSAPIEAQAQNIQTAIGSLDEASPAGDALVVPQILKAVVAGQGSGVRITQSEINTVMGGRGKWETLKATLNKFNPNAGQALSITPAQRAQLKRLLTISQDRAGRLLALSNDAGDALTVAPDIQSQRKIVADFKRKRNAVMLGKEVPDPDDALLDEHEIQ